MFILKKNDLYFAIYNITLKSSQDKQSAAIAPFSLFLVASKTNFPNVAGDYVGTVFNRPAQYTPNTA